MPPHKQHYMLTCPNCKTVTESCGCEERWRNAFPARIPCRECTAKHAIWEKARVTRENHRAQTKKPS